MSGTTAGPTSASSSASGAPAGNPGADPLWKHTSKTWLKDMAAMIALGLIFTLITWRRLTAMGPTRRY